MMQQAATLRTAQCPVKLLKRASADAAAAVGAAAVAVGMMPPVHSRLRRSRPMPNSPTPKMARSRAW